MTRPWRVLYGDAHPPDAPPLLLKYELKSSSYKIWVSDLVHVWAEALDRKAIIRQSLALDTSIDPSEGPDQFTLLLQKLEHILQGKSGTSISIGSGDANDAILLQLSSSLPGSLKPLEWTCALSRQPQCVLTKMLMIPLLTRLPMQYMAQESLLQELKDKDHVIARLTEKMQAEGGRLNAVFPGASMAKSSSRSANPLKAVKGLSEFEQETWRSNFELRTKEPTCLADLLTQAVEGGLPCEDHSTLMPEYGEWWRMVKKKDVEHDLSHRTGPDKPLDHAQCTVDDKSFQASSSYDLSNIDDQGEKRATRPSSPGERETPAVFTASEDGSTTDEDSQSPSSEHGEFKEEVVTSPPELTRNDDENENGKPHRHTVHEQYSNPMDVDAVESSALDDPLIPNPSEPVINKAKSKLGRIGGRRKSPAPRLPQTSEAESTAVIDFSTHGQSEAPRLEHPAEQTTPSTRAQPREASSERQQEITHPRETTPERANRRRRELDEQLQAQARAPPKKKRKF